MKNIPAGQIQKHVDEINGLVQEFMDRPFTFNGIFKLAKDIKKRNREYQRIVFLYLSKISKEKMKKEVYDEVKNHFSSRKHPLNELFLERMGTEKSKFSIFMENKNTPQIELFLCSLQIGVYIQSKKPDSFEDLFGILCFFSVFSHLNETEYIEAIKEDFVEFLSNGKIDTKFFESNLIEMNDDNIYYFLAKQNQKNLANTLTMLNSNMIKYADFLGKVEKSIKSNAEKPFQLSEQELHYLDIKILGFAYFLQYLYRNAEKYVSDTLNIEDYQEIPETQKTEAIK